MSPPRPESELSPIPPNSEAVEWLTRRRRFWFRAIWISLAGVLVPPLIGLVGTIIGMTRAYGELNTVGSADPSALATNISFSLHSTSLGLLVSLLALMFLILALVRYCGLPKPMPPAGPQI